MTAFSTFLPILTSAISFICSELVSGHGLTRAQLARLGRRAYLEQNHGRDLLGGEGLLLAEVLNLNLGVATIIDDCKRPGLDVLLDGRVIKAAADQTPGEYLSTLG